jgi:hypothetical protein
MMGPGQLPPLAGSFHVMNRSPIEPKRRSAPLSECQVTSVRDPQEQTRLIRVDSHRGRDRFVEVVENRSVTVSLDCSAADRRYLTDGESRCPRLAQREQFSDTEMVWLTIAGTNAVRSLPRPGPM